MEARFKGVIKNILDTTFEVNSVEGYQGDVFVNVSEAELKDLWGSIVDIEYFKEGMEVSFNTNGIMALSMPPRVTALELEEATNLKIMALKVMDVNPVRALIEDETSPYNDQIVLVNSENTLEFKKDVRYKVAYNGMMTRSIPPHIFVESAIEIEEEA